MADPFLLSTQYQERLDNSTKALEDIPKYVMEGIKIPGMISQNRILGIRAKEAQMELTSNEQLQSMIDDPAGFARKFGDLKTAKEMREHMANNSAIAITPAGQRIMGVWDKITTLKEDSEQHSIQRIGDLEFAKKDADFRMKHGLPQNATQEQRATATADDNVEEFLTYANKFGKDGSQVDIQPTDFDVNGNWLPGAKLRLLKTAPVSESIASRETIALEQIASREKMAQELGDLRRDLLDTKTMSDFETLQMKLENNIEVQELRNAARVAVSEGQVSREQFINRQLHQTATRIAATKEGRKMTPEAVNSKAMKLLGESFDQEISSKRPSPGQSGSSAKEVRRTTKDGRTAIFDADTKKFLRYAD